jgi:CRISPR system Cascade subunit CasE
MFLTRMQLNPARRAARHLLSSPQSMHAAVLAGLSDARSTADGRVLWRLDTYARHKVLLYTVSPDKPDFTHLVEQIGWPTTESWETRAYEGLLDSLAIGQRWQFRLTANPVRSGRRNGWVDTKPLAHITVKQQEEWLLDRSERLGFRIAPGLVAADRDTGRQEHDLVVVDRSVRRFERQGARVTVAMTTFQGHLEVADARALRRSLTHGIGRAKAYGCGLLTLARPVREASA